MRVICRVQLVIPKDLTKQGHTPHKPAPRAAPEETSLLLQKERFLGSPASWDVTASIRTPFQILTMLPPNPPEPLNAVPPPQFSSNRLSLCQLKAILVRRTWSSCRDANTSLPWTTWPTWCHGWRGWPTLWSRTWSRSTTCLDWSSAYGTRKQYTGEKIARLHSHKQKLV